MGMLVRFAKLWAAMGLLAAVWGIGRIPRAEGGAWVHPVAARPGPVRILRFDASVGILVKGEKATLCYRVENAKSIRISPFIAGVYPWAAHCLEIVPEHTTHYTLLAEGFDGTVAAQSVTLAVEAAPQTPPPVLDYADEGAGRRYSMAAAEPAECVSAGGASSRRS
jgi:hypothetical protein